MYEEFSVALKELGISEVVSPIKRLQLLKAFQRLSICTVTVAL